MQPPQIIGWAHSKFGKAPEEDVEQLLAGVIPEALQHSGVGPEEIDGIFVGVYNNGFSRQSFEGALAGMAVPALAGVPWIKMVTYSTKLCRLAAISKRRSRFWSG